ncbi:MAG: VWA domain-containing protein [Candidatus Aminicenantes bacterium]|nr:VWA domain-containing protein [Candidatus Aminicenantes bacterium]
MKKNIFLFFLLLAFFLHPCLHELSSGSLQVKVDQEELKHEVVVVLKLVQVYVTDKKGSPVTNLEKFDFTLYDSGKLQTVTDFERHIFKPEKELKDTQPDRTRKTSPMLNRKFFFLLDYSRNDVFGVTKSKNAALHFIDTKLQPTDEVGVLSYSRMKGLILHEYLTTDHQKVRKAVKKMRGTLKGEEEESEGTDPGESYLESGALVEASGSAAEERRFEKVRAQEFTKIIREFAKSLRYIPGNKNIILFSAGLSSSLMYDRYDSTLRELFEDMSKELASSSTPVYTVNTYPLGRALAKGRRGGDDSLRFLSDLSGGKYFNNVAHYESNARAIQNITGNYYVLGYYIDEKWDGKYHEIKVKVQRKGCKVYAQGGFFNPKPFTEFSEVEKRFHLFDLAMSENPQFQVPYILPSVALPFSEKQESNLVMLSEISIDKIKEVMKGETEVLSFNLDEENTIANYSEGKINFYTLPQKKIYLYSISSLSPGKHECRLVLRDIKTGKGAVASSPVVIPEASGPGIKLFPPLLLIPEKQAVYLKLSRDQKKGTEKKSLSLKDIYSFLPNNFSPLVEEVDRGILKLPAVLRLSIVDIQECDIEIAAHLINHSSNKKIPLPNSSILYSENKEGIEVLLVEFRLPELEPGKYTMEIIAEEMTTKTKSHTTRTFKIR